VSGPECGALAVTDPGEVVGEAVLRLSPRHPGGASAAYFLGCTRARFEALAEDLVVRSRADAPHQLAWMEFDGDRPEVVFPLSRVESFTWAPNRAIVV
jgi:hypothetical protein